MRVSRSAEIKVKCQSTENSKTPTMPSRLRIRLTLEEKQYLFELEVNPKTTKRTKQRVEVLLLSDKGLKISIIADCLNIAYNTVRQTLYRWIIKEKEGLFDAPRPGRKPICSTADIKYVEECLKMNTI